MLEHAVHPPGALERASPLPAALRMVVEAAHAVGAALHEVAQRVAHADAVEHALAELVDPRARVVRRGERVRPVVVGAVAKAGHARIGGRVMNSTRRRRTPPGTSSLEIRRVR